MSMETYYDNYLSHHGIKGQKWGIRRFQNADGTRTALGRDRIKKGFSKAKDGIKNSSVKERAAAAGATLATISVAQSIQNMKVGQAVAAEMGLRIPMSTIVGKTAFAAGKWATIAALSVIGGHMIHDYMKSANNNRLKRAADAQQRDADDLRKHGYIEEADAVQKVANKTRSKIR